MTVGSLLTPGSFVGLTSHYGQQCPIWAIGRTAQKKPHACGNRRRRTRCWCRASRRPWKAPPEPLTSPGQPPTGTSNQRELIAAALPEVGRDSLLSAEPPAQAQARLDLVVRAAIAFTIEWEPLLRHHFGCPWIPMANVRRCAVDARSPGTSMPLSR